MKIETLTFEYDHCGKCPASLSWLDENKCDRTDKRIPDLWGDIPDWCPLETKLEKE